MGLRALLDCVVVIVDVTFMLFALTHAQDVERNAAVESTLAAARDLDLVRSFLGMPAPPGERIGGIVDLLEIQQCHCCC